MPGDLGPPLAPITPSVARVTFTCSDSNHSSRKSAALCVKILTRPTISFFESPRSFPAELQILDKIADTRAAENRAEW